jgi:hypothetical protein
MITILGSKVNILGEKQNLVAWRTLVISSSIDVVYRVGHTDEMSPPTT